MLERLAIGLRTFYRDDDLLKWRGIKTSRQSKACSLRSNTVEAEPRLTLPYLQPSFADMAKLSRHPGDDAHCFAKIDRAAHRAGEASEKEGRLILRQ